MSIFGPKVSPIFVMKQDQYNSRWVLVETFNSQAEAELYAHRYTKDKGVPHRVLSTLVEYDLVAVSPRVEGTFFAQGESAF